MTDLTSIPSASALAELFDKDPFKLTQGDLASMAAYFRAERARFATEDAEARKKGSYAKGTKAPKAVVPDLDLDGIV